MAGISFATLSQTTEPLQAHSAASHATRKALRAAMAALAVAGDKGPVLHAGIALVEGAEISGTVTKLKSDLEAVVKAPGAGGLRSDPSEGRPIPTLQPANARA